MTPAPRGNIAPALSYCLAKIEKLNEEKKVISADIADVFAEAKEKGLNVKTLREILRIRKMNDEERAEAELLRDVYLRAIGLLE